MNDTDLPPLSRRERQIMDILYTRGKASAAEVRGDPPDKPSDSAVRTSLRLLEEKSHVQHAREGRKLLSSTVVKDRLVAIPDGRMHRTPRSKRGISVASTLASFLLVPMAALQLTTREALGLQIIGGETNRIESELSELDGETLVPAIIVAAGESAQAAIDAATPGSTVRLAAGTYLEALKIDKDLTLVGNGWQNTHVRGTESDTTALEVTGPAKVVLHDLRFSSPGSTEMGRLGSHAVVSLHEAEVVMENCAVIEGSANGILVKAGSAATIRQCFVSAMWAEGIYVEAGAKATISQTDVRNVYHYGIKILGEGTTVEACRVSGTGWHGIRFDHVSPTIRGNLLFDNERFGIYYNGKTNATITQNHFHHNAMAGIAAWGSGEDLIENNTFSHNLRGGLEVLEESNPKVRRNIFFKNGVGVSTSNISAESPFAAHLDQVVFEENYFWENGANTRFLLPVGVLEPRPEDFHFERDKNWIADPMFLGSEDKNYKLLARSSARILNVGAHDPLAFESPWPVTPEEARFLEARDPKSEPRPKPPANSLQAMSQPWIDGALQIDDPILRAQSIEKMRAALASGDEARRHAALVAFLGSLEAIEDKASFRELILPNVHSTDGGIQRVAFYALYNSGAQPGDLDLVLNEARKKTPGLFGSISHLVALYSGGRIEGESSRVLEDLFATEDKQELNELLGGLWGAELSVPLESRVIGLAHSEDRDLRHNAIYFGLSTLANKSRAVLEVLFEAAQGSDQSDSGRALWGLSHGVRPEHASLVADFGIELLRARTSSRSRKKCVTLIEDYAGEAQLQSLEALIANELLDAKTREELVPVVERIRRR